jgi:hypothetical protein
MSQDRLARSIVNPNSRRKEGYGMTSKAAYAERITSVSWWKALSEEEREEMIQHESS